MVGKRRLTGAAIAAPLALAVLFGGCDKPPDRTLPAPGTDPTVSTSATQPATAPAEPMTHPATAPSAESPGAATQAAATLPAHAYLLVDGRPVEFPAAKIILTRKSDRLRARLFSDNPKSALEDDYAGHSFYFDVPLEPDPEQPGQWVWRYKSPDSEASDSPNGVYLNGLKTHLQPFDVLVTADGAAAPRVGVEIVPMSQFRAFEKGAPPAASRLVMVSGKLSAEVVER